MEEAHGVSESHAEAEAHAPAPDPLADRLAPADWAAADEMRRRTFSVVAQGYDQDEVRAYLTHLAEVFATLSSQLSELRRVEVPLPAPNGSEEASGLASRMADVLKEAEEHAARVREEAEGEAKLILAGAQQRAEQVQHEAEQIAAEARRQVQQDAEQRVTEAQHRAEEADEAAHRAVADAERRVAEAHAVRDAVLAEVQAAWQRLSQVASHQAAETPVGEEPAVPPPPAPGQPA